MLIPPHFFGIVEDYLYRCQNIDHLHYPFLQTLGLKTIIHLNPEVPSKPFKLFTKENGIELLHLGLRPWRPILSNGEEWRVLDDDLIQDAFTYILDKNYYPMVIVDITCTLVGVLRKLLHWSYSSIVGEYRAMNGEKSHYWNELYLEMISIKLETEICIDINTNNNNNTFTIDENNNDKQMKAILMMNNGGNFGQMTRRKCSEIILPKEINLPDWFKFERDLWSQECIQLRDG